MRLPAIAAADGKGSPTERFADAVETPGRVQSVDFLRGLVMIVMALDHTRDYFSRFHFAPEDLSRATPFLFFTRWITHFCAPAFFLLAGLGSALSLSRGRTKKSLSWFLLTRGLWLMVLELTIIDFGWNFDFDFPRFLIVIWALGLSMVVLAGLIFLPEKLIAALSLLMIAGHNLLDGIRPDTFGALAPLWHVLHAPGIAVPDKAFIGYPLIPWCGVMALGFSLGRIYRWEAAARKRFLLGAGLAAIAAFLLLRGLNLYGNPFPWSEERSAAMTVASFLNTLKYPPSLHFLLMTLGPILVMLAVFERARGRFVEFASVYGKVPMFYYVMHLFVIHLLAYGFALWQGDRGDFLGLDLSQYPDWHGTSLFGVYVAWIIVVLLLYIPCRWFAGLKARRKDWWLSYM